MNSTNFASTFAPYTPPPDDPAHASSSHASSNTSRVRPWFPAPSLAEASSYQSGALPTFGTAYGGGGGVSMGGDEEPDGSVNRWETRFGTRVDVLAAFAYLFGPLSALLCLVLETHNDYVRFHAYQSALATTPFVLFYIFSALVHFPSFLKVFIVLCIVFLQAFMAFRAFIDASRNNLNRFYLPHVGPLADRWVSEE